ncbi:hypothetical protein M441DRAFT_376410 [Trichoderma asperellum CBS 433.97]|uniref:Uncharacterized protein n=1 Tax=Trichoderma asperellum (strain ATCC 204424 / CBS 433.97 / NBRC 101777) TaxID=1042311 RepID=A0A2T3ZFR1_TRIA4|nr:hypothetical protein M441DRAFT_376410 [Trichoderma asperellum CBS 433.97]PTB43635.1 hypothetical protein M441DRAFT_376410 [Trichoderma asperellum CBS 433.97]
MRDLPVSLRSSRANSRAQPLATAVFFFFFSPFSFSSSFFLIHTQCEHRQPSLNRRRKIFSAAKLPSCQADSRSSLATAAISHRQANVPNSTRAWPHLINADSRSLGLAWLGLAELGLLDADDNVTRDSGPGLSTSAGKLQDTAETADTAETQSPPTTHPTPHAASPLRPWRPRPSPVPQL